MSNEERLSELRKKVKHICAMHWKEGQRQFLVPSDEVKGLEDSLIKDIHNLMK